MKKIVRRIIQIISTAAFSATVLMLVTSYMPVCADTVPKEEHTWQFSAFGTNASISGCGYEADLENRSLHLFSEGSTGKLVPQSTDGLAFYYTAIDPDSENFVLRATAQVNSWYYTNGQEGFGLMAADRVGDNGNNHRFWNNSYMASVTKVVYLWNGTGVSNAGDEITMRLGVGSQEKKGVTPEAIAEDYTLEDMELFSSTMTPLDVSCAGSGAGSYNLVGNFTNTQAPPGTIDEPVTTFDLCIEKNNTGYFVSYTDQHGHSNVKKYYDPDALRALDSDHVYIGFFAAKNVDITFSDISFTTSDPQTDPEAEDQPVTPVDPLYRVMSSASANSPTTPPPRFRTT